MTTTQLILLVVGILLVQAVTWVLVIKWVGRRTRSQAQIMSEQGLTKGMHFIIGPQVGLYRASDSVFGNVKGNGVICLTDHELIFEELTGQRIEIPRTEITCAAVENTFKGKTSWLTGGKHLVVRTGDGNRIGFLLKNAEQWVQTLSFRNNHNNTT